MLDFLEFYHIVDLLMSEIKLEVNWVAAVNWTNSNTISTESYMIDKDERFFTTENKLERRDDWSSFRINLKLSVVGNCHEMNEQSLYKIFAW